MMNIVHSKIELPYRRHGFTLVELLMVIAILAVLGGLALSMIGGARHDANAARTETQIRRITHFIEARLEDYAVRILPYRLQEYSLNGVPLTRQDIAKLRNRILIEYIRAEMPCRLTQVSPVPVPPANNFPSAQFIFDFGTVPNVVDRANTVPMPPRILLVDDEMKIAPPSLVARMARKLNTPPSIATVANEQAECLFEILNSHNDYASSGMDFIFAAEIKDTDGDGHNEILDAWGDPLQFTLHVRTDEPSVLVPGPGLDTMDPTLIDYMNKEGPLSVHFDVTSVNMPK